MFVELAVVQAYLCNAFRLNPLTFSEDQNAQFRGCLFTEQLAAFLYVELPCCLIVVGAVRK